MRSLAPSRRSAQAGGAVRSALLFVFALGLLALAAVSAGVYFGYREAHAPGPLSEPRIVLIEQGESLAGIASEAERAGVVRHGELFKLVARIRGLDSALKAGEYRVPARASLNDLIDLFASGESILHFVTAPEGMTTAQILAIVAKDDVLVGELSADPAEGALLPETYGFTRGETRDALIARMVRAQNELIDALWPERANDLPFTTRDEALILASIVEKETALEAERGRIASVFVNRLRRGMRLQSDPTIIYGLTQGEPLGRGLRVSELRSDTPYNTYVIDGLPPTPIANPGAAAIRAVLNPPETEDLFFVANGEGGHVFATNNRDHERNVRAWREIERRRREGE